ncbi:MAG: ABC transporter permease subunit [Deltaproteobacteria bacterium]|nr:ABC transporter permease subunit [Deltaproteobacteria bacterium]
MNKIGLVAWITFKDCIRNKALYGIILLGLVLFFFNIIITGMFSWEAGKVAVDMGLSIISFSGLILIFFFSINSISSDIYNRTIYLILSRPVSKAHYILGKYTGLSLIILLSSIILGLCAAVSVKLSFLSVDRQIPFNFSWSIFFLSILFLTISLLIMMALAVFWVSVTTHQFTALLLTLGSYFVGQSMENVKNIILSTKLFTNDSLPVKVISCVSWIMPNLAAFDLKTTAAYGLPVNASILLWVALYGISYIGVVLTLTIFIFQRRELA